METKFCPKCGSELPADAKFCIYCGTPQPTEAAPVPETVIPPETEEKAPVPETVILPETEEKAPVPETVSLSETEEKAPISETVSLPETEEKTPVPETVSPPKPEVKAPVPDNRYMDYSYEPQSYEVENGNSQGAGALVVFLLVLAMIVVSLVVCMVMATASFVNKSIKNKDKDFSVSYDYDDYDYDDDEGGGYVDEDDEYGYDGADDDRGYEDRRENFLNSLYPWLDSTQEPMDGYFKSGDYKVGEDIPAGTYFVKANIYKMESSTESVAYRSISTDADDEDVLISGWFNYSTYVELKEGTYFHMSHCGAFDVSKCPIENDPFEHHGTFMVGLDVEPGVYTLSPDGSDIGGYSVYESAGDIGIPFWVSDSRALYEGNVYGGEEIVLEEGQFLELTDAVLSYGDDTGDAADTADDDGEVFYGSD